MNKDAIIVKDLSKRYKLGAIQERHNTLRDLLMDGVKQMHPRNWRRANARNEFWALNGVSFRVGEGETIGIIGRNGAGKSTLLKVLSRITEPTKGEASVTGRVGSLLEVGAGFHWELTGRENVFLNGAILGMSKEEIKRKFDSIVEFSEIGKFIDTPVKHYSSGMYVRLAFSVAAHLEPEILMIDEVLSVGDVQFQQKCMDYAKRLRETDKTVLFVSHNMFAIKTLCSRVIYLSEGKVRFDGPTAEAISLYENEGRLDAMGYANEAIGGEKSKWPMEITDIELYDEKDVPCTVFGYGEKMKVRLKFRANEKVKDANVIIAMIRSDNVACCNYCSALDSSPTTFLIGEGGVELVTPPLKLIADQYQIVILVRDKNFNALYCAQNGKSFHIRHGLFSKHFGVFHEAAEWRWLNGQDLLEQNDKTERGEQS